MYINIGIKSWNQEQKYGYKFIPAFLRLILSKIQMKNKDEINEITLKAGKIYLSSFFVGKVN